jgi:hypothetical protein
MKSTGTRAKPRKPAAPPRLRCKLKTISDVEVELARLYRSAKSGRIAVGDASRLANILAILGRMIEGSDIEARLEKLEEVNVRDS